MRAVLAHRVFYLKNVSVLLTNWQAAWLQIAEKGDRTNESEDGGDSDISLAYSYERKLSRDLDQLLEPAGLAFMKHVFF